MIINFVDIWDNSGKFYIYLLSVEEVEKNIDCLSVLLNWFKENKYV